MHDFTSPFAYTGVVVLALLAGFVLWHSFGPLRWRRLGTGLALLSAAGLLCWALQGTSIPWPRAMIVVFSEEAGPDALEAVATAFGAEDRVAWLRLCPGVGDTATAQWTTGSAARRQPDEDNAAYRARIHRQSCALTVEGPDWCGRLLSRVDEMRAALLPAGTWQPTLLCLHDRGPTWSALTPRDLDLPAAVRRLATPATQVYLFPWMESEIPGRLELDLDCEVVPQVPLAELGQQRVHLNLVGAEALRRQSPRYRVRVWLDGGPDASGEPHYFHESDPFDDPGDNAPFPRIPLADLKPRQAPSRVLERGFHRVLVELQATVGKRTTTYTAARYFQTAPRNLVVVQPDVPRPLTQSRPVLDPAQLLREFLERKKDGQRARTNLGPKQVESFTYAAVAKTPQNARNALTEACTLVLVEPTTEQLTQLDESLGLLKRLSAGLTVLVIGPPTRVGTPPAWLPAFALPPDSAPAAGLPLEIRRDRRVYFAPELIRLLKFPARTLLHTDVPRPDAPTGLSVQRDVINLLARELGSAEDLVKLTGVDDIQPNLAAAGEAKPVAGSILTGGERLPLKLYPPSAPLLHHDSKQPNDPTNPIKETQETAAASLPLRLGIYESLSPPGTSDFALLEPPHRYPGSTLVLFSSDLPYLVPPQPDLRGRFRTSTAPNTAWPAAPTESDAILANLVARGMNLCVVHLRIDGHYARVLSGALPSSGQRNLETYLKPVRDAHGPAVKEVVLDLDAGSVQRTVGEIATWLRDQKPATLSRSRVARVLDERSMPARRAPERHYLLDPKFPGNGFASPYATIVDPRFPETRPESRTPAICAQVVREGRVIVLGYSPFAHDLWERDYLPASADGWGVQRLLDLCELTSPTRPVPEQHPLVRGLRVAEDGATLRIDCRASLATSGEARPWREPSLHVANRADLLGTGRLQTVDADGEGATFEFRFARPLRGWYELRLDDVIATPESRPLIYLDLAETSSGGRTGREALARLAGLTGGGTLDPGAAREGLVYRRPGAWIVGLSLAVLGVLLFSPVLRTWAILRRKVREESPPLETAGQATFDVEAVLVEWGMNPGSPQATRRAGNPAGEKPYEPGDSLSAARPASLLPFTTAGRTLPLRRPVVRQRVVTRAMEAFILLDCTPGLQVPEDIPSKTDYLVMLVRLLAGAVWSAAGQVRVLSIQQPGTVWGPCGAGTEPVELEQYVRNLVAVGCRRAPGRLVLPEDCGSGHIVFLISDMLADREQQLHDLLEYAGREEISIRLAQLQGTGDAELVGLGRSALTGRLLDRSEWSPTELARAHQAHADRIRALVEAGGGRVAAVSSDLLPGEVFARLVERELLT